MGVMARNLNEAADMIQWKAHLHRDNMKNEDGDWIVPRRPTRPDSSGNDARHSRDSAHHESMTGESTHSGDIKDPAEEDPEKYSEGVESQNFGSPPTKPREGDHGDHHAEFSVNGYFSTVTGREWHYPSWWSNSEIPMWKK